VLEDDAKAAAAACWSDMGLDQVAPWTEEQLVQAILDWKAGAEPFDDPPANVDPATGEVLEQGQLT
jgi:hypothetical protein